MRLACHWNQLLAIRRSSRDGAVRAAYPESGTEQRGDSRPPDARPAFWLRDVGAPTFSGCACRNERAAFDLYDVKEFRSFGSRRLADVSLDNVENHKMKHVRQFTTA
jgi:hypothetical protein